MKKLVLLILPLAGFLMAASPGVSAQTNAGPATASAERGKNLYVKNFCWSCHGYAGAGAVTGPRLSQPRLNAQAFTTFIRNPRSMPKFSAVVVSDAEAADMYAYIMTFPAPPALESIELLKNLN